MTVFDDKPRTDDDLHVRQDGSRHAPALLLIHGSASSTRSWDQLVPLLTGVHHVIRVDLLGHGRSAKPDGGYEISEQARRVGETLDRLGVDETIVVGHSSGGYAATALAERRPELVTALALINTGPSLDAFIAPNFALDPSQWPPTDEQLRQLASTGFGRADFPVPTELLDEVRAMTYHSLTRTMGASLEYLKRQAIPRRLAVVAKPLLVVYGEQDRRWRPSDFDDYRAVPGARVEKLTGVGHTPIIEDPHRTAQTLLGFTSAHSPWKG